MFCQALLSSLLSDSEMIDALDLQVNVRDANGKRMDIQLILKSIPSVGATTITWSQLMCHFSSSVEIRRQASLQGRREEHQEEEEKEEKEPSPAAGVAPSANHPSTNDISRHSDFPAASPENRWFDRLDSALSGTPSHMTPTGVRLMERYNAITSVNMMSSMSEFSGESGGGSGGSGGSGSGSGEGTVEVMPSKMGTTATMGGAMTPHGVEIEERATMAARAQRLIRGLTRTPPTTQPTPDHLMMRMSKYAADSMLSTSTTNATTTEHHQHSLGPYNQSSSLLHVSPPTAGSSTRSPTRSPPSFFSRYSDVVHETSASSSSMRPSSTEQAAPGTPGTPEAVRDLFAFHRKMTKPRKQEELFMNDLSPMKAAYVPPTASRRNHHSATTSTIPKLIPRVVSPTRRSTRMSPRRSPTRDLAAATLPPPNEYSTSHSSSSSSAAALTQFDAVSSRSAAMELLSSLRESLNRSDAGLDFRASPTAGILHHRTPIRRVPNIDIVSSRMSTSRRMRISEVGEEQNLHSSPPRSPPRSPPHSHPLSHASPAPTNNSVSKSLDTVTKSALDVLSRLKQTNQHLFDSATPMSPSFSYLTSSPATNSYVMTRPALVTNLLTRASMSVRNTMNNSEGTVEHSFSAVSSVEPQVLAEPSTPGVKVDGVVTEIEHKKE